MRYFYPVENIFEIDMSSLSQSISEAGVAATVHIGNGVVLVETREELPSSDKTILDSLIQAHKPTFYEWTDSNGQVFKSKVRTIEDVNRLTAQRIRQCVGGEGDPVQEQLKLMRKFLWALDVQVNPGDYTLDQFAKATAIRSDFLGLHDKVEQVVQDGKTFKIDKKF